MNPFLIVAAGLLGLWLGTVLFNDWVAGVAAGVLGLILGIIDAARKAR